MKPVLIDDQSSGGCVVFGVRDSRSESPAVLDEGDDVRLLAVVLPCIGLSEVRRGVVEGVVISECNDVFEVFVEVRIGVRWGLSRRHGSKSLFSRYRDRDASASPR